MNAESNVFIWKHISTWRNAISQLITGNLRISLEDSIRKRRADFEYLDDVPCFEKLYSEFGDYSALIDRLTSEFPCWFQCVRAYHCCRPIGTQSYYSEGIRVLDFDYANARFRDAILGNPLFSNVPEAHLESAFSEMRGSFRRHGFVYFGLDDRYLLEHGKHYLCKGSEYSQSLAVLVERATGAIVSEYLKTIGKPTVFEVNLPSACISDDDLRNLGSHALFAWAYDVAHGTADPFHVDFTVDLDRDLLPEFIVRHYHPNDSDLS